MRGMASYTQRSLAMTVCSDRRQGKPSPKRVPGGAGRASAGALSRSVFRSERAAFPREVAARVPDRAELHLCEAGVALLSNDTLPADCEKKGIPRVRSGPSKPK